MPSVLSDASTAVHLLINAPDAPIPLQLRLSSRSSISANLSISPAHLFVAYLSLFLYIVSIVVGEPSLLN